MRVLVLVTVMGLCAACASTRPAISRTESTGPAAPTVPVRGATPAWQYALPPRWDVSQVRISDTAVVIGSRSDVRVLDPASGRLRWQRDGSASAILLSGAVVYGAATGAVASRALSSGRVLWERRAVCPVPTGGAPVGGAEVIVRHADDLVVGCYGGDVVRVAAASGSIRARSGAFAAERIVSIVPLGPRAYGITGSSSGAAMIQHAAILDCKRLTVIVPEQDELQILGSIGNIAALDDRCCKGRPDVYRPATIVRANLTTGALSPGVDLTPELDRYPSDHLPIGQGSPQRSSMGTSFTSSSIVHCIGMATRARPPRPLGESRPISPIFQSSFGAGCSPCVCGSREGRSTIRSFAFATARSNRSGARANQGRSSSDMTPTWHPTC